MIIDAGKREIGNGVVHVMLYIAFAVEPRKLSDFRLAGYNSLDRRFFLDTSSKFMTCLFCEPHTCLMITTPSD